MMTVSHSDFVLYRKCPRWWCYKQMAQWNAKDFRRELHLLKKTQSVEMWRGSLVDEVISEELVPIWKRGSEASLEWALEQASERFDLQLAFARERRYKEPGMSQKKAGKSFAALAPFENGDLPEDQIKGAWADVETALINLFSMAELIEKLRSADYLSAQWEYRLKHSGVTVRAIPDLVAIWRRGAVPLVLDWKVYRSSHRDARNQLALYALVLTEGDHPGFSADLRKYQPTALRLREVRLLEGCCRDYDLSDEDVEDVDSMIAANVSRMRVATDDLPPKSWNPADFPRARYAETCAQCPFKAPCWATNN